jgi:hypothetical protein
LSTSSGKTRRENRTSAGNLGDFTVRTDWVNLRSSITRRSRHVLPTVPINSCFVATPGRNRELFKVLQLTVAVKRRREPNHNPMVSGR